MKTLNLKGSQEKHLSESISILLKENIIHNLTPEDEYKDSIGDFSVGDNIDFREEVTIEGIIQDLLEIQSNFTAYLLMKDLQWQSEEYRTEFVTQLKQTYDIQELKESLKKLQECFLFVEKMRSDNIG